MLGIIVLVEVLKKNTFCLCDVQIAESVPYRYSLQRTTLLKVHQHRGRKQIKPRSS
jgi:hypothetical protein